MMDLRIAVVIPVSRNPISYVFFERWRAVFEEARAMLAFYNVRIWTVHAKHYSVGMARELGVQNALDAGATHIFFLDDDIIPAPDTPNPLVMLLSLFVPIACGIYYEKNMKGLNIHKFEEEGSPLLDKDGKPMKVKYLDGKERAAVTSYPNYTPQEVDEWMRKYGPFMPVGGCGLGMALIDARVFQELPKPWFHMNPVFGEDLYFLTKARTYLKVRPIAHLGVRGWHILGSTFVLDWNGSIIPHASL